VKGASFEVEFDSRTGALTKYAANGQDLLAAPLHLNFWRQPVDNDRGRKDSGKSAVWRDAGSKAVATAVNVGNEDGAVVVGYDIDVPAGETKAKVSYTVRGNGMVDVDVWLKPAGKGIGPLPRVGMVCRIPKKLDTWSWYGRGPHETQIDRKAGGRFGEWSVKLAEAWFPYVEPQATANRTDVRHASFTQADGMGFEVQAVGAPLEMAAYPFAMEDLEGPRHPCDIPRRDFATLHIDHAQMGVGGINSWGAWPLPKHMLWPAREYRYRFTIQLR